MRIVLASTFVPFINGGARFIVEWLETQLQAHGHEVERFYLPFIDDPESLLDQTAALRMLDLAQAGDRLITFRPPAHVIEHPHKILWFIHHIRSFYDLWDTEYSAEHSGPNVALRESLKRLDTLSIGEAKRVYTNSKIVADRLARFNGIAAEPLYPPILNPERFTNSGYGDEVVVVCRMEPHKRQDLLIEALKHTRTPVRIRLCGRASSPAFAARLAELAGHPSVAGRVVFEDRWISEDEKAEILSGALAAAYCPQDEDSYGYPSLEAAHAEKAVLTTTDAGGVLELVEDGCNGFVAEPTPQALADALDRLYADRRLARRMGRANLERLKALRIDWTRVVEALTA